MISLPYNWLLDDGDLGLWFGLEEVSDSGMQTTAYLSCSGSLFNFFSDNDGSSAVTRKTLI